MQETKTFGSPIADVTYLPRQAAYAVILSDHGDVAAVKG